jgi:hypothetical protein
MPSRESILIATAGTIGAFLDENAALLGPNIVPSRKNLDTAVAQLTAVALTQSGAIVASKGATARRRSLRAALRGTFMKPVADVAKLKLATAPELPALTMPKKALGATPLVAAAHAMADAAEPHQTVFTEAGLPDDFIPQLRTAADDVTSSLDGRVQQVAAARGTTASVNAMEVRIQNLFRLIDLLVLPKLGTSVVLLAKWKAAKAVSPVVSSAPAQTPATTAAAAASAEAPRTPAATPAAQ